MDKFVSSNVTQHKLLTKLHLDLLYFSFPTILFPSSSAVSPGERELVGMGIRGGDVVQGQAGRARRFRACPQLPLRPRRRRAASRPDLSSGSIESTESLGLCRRTYWWIASIQSARLHVSVIQGIRCLADQCSAMPSMLQPEHWLMKLESHVAPSSPCGTDGATS